MDNTTQRSLCHPEKKTGEFVCDPSKSPNPEFRDAYDWLNGKMQKKIPKPDPKIKDPIWAWYRTDWLHRRPGKEFLKEYSESSVLLEIGDSKVLLTDFEEWHYVLNRWPIDDSRNEKEWEDYLKWYDNLPNSERTKIMEKSWDSVFNIDPFNSKWRQKGCYVQATFWRLEYSNVRNKWNL